LNRQAFFAPGQTVVIREIWDGKIWGVQPVIVVQDRPDLMAFYATFDTITKMPCKPDGGRVRASDRAASRWVLVDRGWNNLDLLRLNIPGSIYSVIIFWFHPEMVQYSWYINLEEPLRRTIIGFDFMDQWLDVIVKPDFSGWHWKDEDELEEAVSLGLISPEKAEAMHAEGERVIAWLQSGKSPFNGWEEWRPDPSWKVPVLLEGWDKI
jgi:hypothetical protein